jgi:hypothetical protein
MPWRHNKLRYLVRVGKLLSPEPLVAPPKLKLSLMIGGAADATGVAGCTPPGSAGFTLESDWAQRAYLLTTTAYRQVRPLVKILLCAG